MGEQTSTLLVDDLDSKDKELRKLTQFFTELARRETVQLPIHCFFETKTSEMLKRFLPPNIAKSISVMLRGKTEMIVWLSLTHI